MSLHVTSYSPTLLIILYIPTFQCYIKMTKTTNHINYLPPKHASHNFEKQFALIILWIPNSGSVKMKSDVGNM